MKSLLCLAFVLVASLALLLGLGAGPAAAGEADVLAVKVKALETGRYQFDVTVKHADEGWKHYADRWEVLGPDGAVLATRVLRHPHVKQQPFTRGLPSVAIPETIRKVTVRARDSVHELGGKEFEVELPDRKE